MTTKYLKSLKAELARHNQYVVTVKDNLGFMHTIHPRGQFIVGLDFKALHKDEAGFNISRHLIDKKTCDLVVQVLSQKDDSFWKDPVEDCAEGDEPLLFVKKSIEVITVGLVYDSEKLKL